MSLVWRFAVLCLAASCVLPSAARAEEPIDLAAWGRIRDLGFNHSMVMETARHLTDAIGPRLTNSPNARTAGEWTRARLAEWGLANAHLEPWGPFGRGWSLEHVSLDLVAPDHASLVALPKAWTPATAGVVRGKAVKAKLESEADLEPWKGKLAGAVVLLGEPRELKGQDKVLKRFSDPDLEALARFETPPPARDIEKEREEFLKRRRFQRALNRFLADEKAVATLEPSSRDGGTLRVMGGGSRRPEEPVGVPALVVAAAQWNRLARLVDEKADVELELEVRATFHDDDPMSYNTVAEIPGGDKKAEVVMLGAHLDSWHAGTGATDNAAGVAVVMEAARILKALETRPRRTIRIALWTGEEQGLLGSRAYVAQHFASRLEPADPEERELPSRLRKDAGPLTLKPEHALLSAYFNLDNGSGRIRGVYLQENAAARPLFESWLVPLRDLQATTATMRKTQSTDHVSFDTVGLPGFQFIQDELEYRGTPSFEFFGTHHTNMDVFDRLQRDDLIQASVVMASFVYQAAMRDERLPRKAQATKDGGGS